MGNFYDKKRLENEEGYIEYLNLHYLSRSTALLYFLHGLTFFLYTYSDLLIITQIAGVIVCIAAFFANKHISTRVAAIMLVVLISISVIIWAYSVDVGMLMRWYIAVALFPLSIYPILTRRDKIALTFLVVAAFLVSTFITYYHEPLAQMPNGELYRTVTSIVIISSIALELFLYSYVNIRKDKGIERIETILNNVQCGIVIVDIQTHELMEINSIARQMFEGDKSMLIGKKCHKLICPAEEGACPITDKNMDVDCSERLLVKADGTTIPIVKSVAKVQYGDRQVLLESFTDIRNIKEAEEQLRRLEVTEHANRAKSEFLSRMSHEMRTPMNAIIGMAQIAERTDDVEKLKYCLSMIDVSSSHLLGLINDVLDMSKIEAGKLELSITPFSLEEVLTKVGHIMCEPIEKKHIDMRTSLTKGIGGRYLGDEMRLSQVITNLMSNAVKFTPEYGSIHLTVEEAPKEPGFSLLRFTVSDTGIGMTNDQVDKLFNAFEQADGSITRQYGGTGLGLAISKNIVEAMGGRIWVETELNIGSAFKFEITLQIVDINEDTNQKIESDYSTPDFSGITVLLVEDMLINREIVIALLEDTNIEIDSAENGQEAVEKFQSTPDRYDLIFMDIQMPIMNGYDATKNIRALDTPKAKSVPIVAMSADAFKEDVEKCLAFGMNDHVKKPVELEIIIEKLSYYLDK